VANAGSYSYVLKDASGATIKTGTTTSTSINFSGLEANSTYTLEVTAISSDTSAYKDSGTLTLTGTTSAPQPVALATPKVSAQVAARTVVTWDAVDKAEAYIVSYEKNGTAVADTTTATSANVDFLPLNTAVTISVVAINESDELSLDSEAGTTSVTRTRSEVSHARAATTVWDDATSAYVTTDVKYRITAYDDGSYTVKNWYGYYGYDLTFMVEDRGTGSITVDGTLYEKPEFVDYAEVDVYGANDYNSVQLYTGSYNGYDYAGLDGDVATSGSFWIWDNTKYEQFCISWWEPSASYQGTWTMPDGTEVKATVNAYSDGTYTIENWYGYDGYDFDFTLDENNGLVPSSEYYCSGDWYWIQYGDDENDGSWIYTTGGYSAWDQSGIWFWDNASNSYYWLQIPTE
jgi:hypothetical protein